MLSLLYLTISVFFTCCNCCWFWLPPSRSFLVSKIFFTSPPGNEFTNKFISFLCRRFKVCLYCTVHSVPSESHILRNITMLPFWRFKKCNKCLNLVTSDQQHNRWPTMLSFIVIIVVIPLVDDGGSCWLLLRRQFQRIIVFRDEQVLVWIRVLVLVPNDVGHVTGWSAILHTSISSHQSTVTQFTIPTQVPASTSHKDFCNNVPGT